MPKSPEASQEEFDHNVDRYPTLKKVLADISREVGEHYAQVERVEVTCLANGDATYRVWTPRADEPEGGFFPGAG